MFHHLDKYARNDAVVKTVFDHLRNYGIAALVWSAAAWKLKHVGVGWVAAWDHFVAAILAVVGFGLMWMNHENLFHKIRNAPGNRWIKALFTGLYTLGLSELFRYLTTTRGG